MRPGCERLRRLSSADAAPTFHLLSDGGAMAAGARKSSARHASASPIHGQISSEIGSMQELQNESDTASPAMA